LLVLCGCSQQASSTDTDSSHYAVLVADGEHQISPSSQKRTPYEIDTASGIRLDVGHFQFTEGGAAVTPDTVQLWNDSVSVGIYRLMQPVVTNVFVLDAHTLKTIHGSDFTGFRSGQHFLIGVGRATPDNLVVVWSGMIAVK
jgi:DNA-binding beta-propeller fold protein YncE